MDGEKRLNVQNALQLYRDTVMQHNFNLLTIVVSMMEAEPLPAQVSAKVANQLHMRELERYFQCSIPDAIKKPRDILDERMRMWLAESCGLDGVSSWPVNLDRRREYWGGIEKGIVEKEVEVEEFPPKDLDVLCELVSGVTGPGIGTHFASQQIAAVSAIEDESLEDMIQSVYVPARDVEGEDSEEYDDWVDLWPDWEIAIAFKIGGGPHEWCGSYALYCRNKDKAQWGWRYGVHDNECCSDVYDSIVDFLLFYSHYKETTEEWVRENFRTIKGQLQLC